MIVYRSVALQVLHESDGMYETCCDKHNDTIQYEYSSSRHGWWAFCFHKAAIKYKYLVYQKFIIGDSIF